MIRVTRGPEPATLVTVRNQQLAILRGLSREPTSKEINGYSIVAEDLWKAQYHKCCYCELRIPKGYNDVEHYRPKAAANRQPGSSDTHGYWWLAFSWENLLFACPACNRSNKNTSFPLDVGGGVLIAENQPPGREHPLLINPGEVVNPVEHIEFVYKVIGRGASRNWWARPRNGSSLGNKTIEVCGLNRSELRELREDHYSLVVIPHVSAIKSAIKSTDVTRLINEFQRAKDLLQARNAFVGLTYDALRADVPEASLRGLIGTGWPLPSLIA